MIDKTLILGQDNNIPVKKGSVLAHYLNPLTNEYTPIEMKFSRPSYATAYTSNLRIENIPEDYPRVDFTTGKPALYIEGGLSYSSILFDTEVFSEFYNNRTSKQYISQLAIRSSADLVLFTQTSGGAYFGDYVSVTAGNSYVASAIVDYSKSNNSLISVRNNNSILSVDLKDGTELFNSLGGTYHIIDYGNSIKRINFIFQATDTTLVFFMLPALNGGTANDNNSIAATCFNITSGKSITSYMELSGSGVTRASDSLTLDDLQNRGILWGNSGSLVIKTTIYGTDSYILALSVNGSTSNELNLQVFSSGNIGFVVKDTNITQSSITDVVNGVIINTQVTIGITYSGNEVKLYVNGQKVNEYQGNILTGKYDTLKFSRSNGSLICNQLIEYFALYKGVLSEQEMLYELGSI